MEEKPAKLFVFSRSAQEVSNWEKSKDGRILGGYNINSFSYCLSFSYCSQIMHLCDIGEKMLG